MQISERGLDLIKRFEGLKLQAYRDSVGIWTIGYGHTKDVKAGQTCTFDEAVQFLKDDLVDAQNAVAFYVRVPLTQSMHDALTSMAFNLGTSFLRNSQLVDKLNAKHYLNVPEQMLRWINAAKQPLLGLARRRAAESVLFLEDGLP